MFIQKKLLEKSICNGLDIIEIRGILSKMIKKSFLLKEISLRNKISVEKLLRDISNPLQDVPVPNDIILTVNLLTVIRIRKTILNILINKYKILEFDDEKKILVIKKCSSPCF